MSSSVDNTNTGSEPVKNDQPELKKLPHTSFRSKNKKGMVIKTKEDQEKKKCSLYKDDSFYISHWLILGFFIAAIGFGYLIPSNPEFSSPAYQYWSLIIAGLAIAVPGVYQTIKKNRHKKTKKPVSKKN